MMKSTTNTYINHEVKQKVSAEEWALRVDLAAAYRLVATY
jgi:hypothetical protein